MTVAFKFLHESSFRSEIFIPPVLANFSDFLAAVTDGLPFLWTQMVFPLRPDFEVHPQRQFLARRTFSKFGVPMGLLNSWIMLLSGRKWIGKVRMKCKNGEKFLYKKLGSIPTHLCLDGCQVVTTQSALDNPPLCSCALSNIHWLVHYPWPYPTHNRLTSYLSLYLKHHQADAFKIIEWFLLSLWWNLHLLPWWSRPFLFGSLLPFHPA